MLHYLAKDILETHYSLQLKYKSADAWIQSLNEHSLMGDFSALSLCKAGDGLFCALKDYLHFRSRSLGLSVSSSIAMYTSPK